MLPGRFLGRDHSDVQLFELFLADWAGRTQHQILVALGLGKCDDVADVLGAGEHHHDAIDAWSDAAMGRHAVLERIQQVTEPLANRLA